MSALPVAVSCYAGHRGEQTPRVLRFGRRAVSVTRVLDQWLAPDHRYFKIQGDDDGIYLVRHATATDGKVPHSFPGPKREDPSRRTLKPARYRSW